MGGGCVCVCVCVYARLAVKYSSMRAPGRISGKVRSRADPHCVCARASSERARRRTLPGADPTFVRVRACACARVRVCACARVRIALRDARFGTGGAQRAEGGGGVMRVGGQGSSGVCAQGTRKGGVRGCAWVCLCRCVCVCVIVCVCVCVCLCLCL